MSVAPNFSEGAVLLVKAGPNGNEMGDCPFSQKANMALRARGVPFSVAYVNLKEKPDWFLDLNPDGTTPTYVNGTEVLTSSDDIVELADEVGTKEPKLFAEDEGEHWDGAFNATAKVFPAIVKLMKNTEEAEERKLRMDMDDALNELNNHLRTVPGRFIVSDSLSALDVNLAPKLAALAALKHYKNYSIPWIDAVLMQYINNVKATDEWKETACSEDVVIWGWSGKVGLPVEAASK